MSGQVNVHAVLREPRTVDTPKGPMEITALSFLVDEPRALVTRVRHHLEASGDLRL